MRLKKKYHVLNTIRYMKKQIAKKKTIRFSYVNNHKSLGYNYDVIMTSARFLRMKGYHLEIDDSRPTWFCGLCL